MHAGPGTEHTETAIADPRQRALILAAMCSALIAVVSAVSGLNVAQFQLSTSLQADQGMVLWVLNGYTIAMAALLLPIGAIGDRYGRKPLLLGGLALFIVASICASQANTIVWLITWRVIGGVAAAMVMPVTLSVISRSFPADKREQAIGIWAGFAGAGGIIGLVVSSYVVDNHTWPWLFAMPVIVAVAALALSAVVVPSSKEEIEGTFDILGSVLSAIAVGGLVLGIHEGPEQGWTSPICLIGVIGGAAAATAFVFWELHRAHPLFDVRVFRHRTLTGGAFALLTVFAMLGAILLAVVSLLQAALGYSALHAAVSLLPFALVMLPLSAVAPMLCKRYGVRTMLVAGPACMAIGLAMLGVMASLHGGYWSVFPGLVIASFGVGLSMTPGTTAITGALPLEEQGVASALNDTVREFGTALGVALIGGALSAGYRAALPEKVLERFGPMADVPKESVWHAKYLAEAAHDQPLLDAARNAFIAGWAPAMWISVGLAVATAIFSWCWIPKKDALAGDAEITMLDLVAAAGYRTPAPDPVVAEAAVLRPAPKVERPTLDEVPVPAAWVAADRRKAPVAPAAAARAVVTTDVTIDLTSATPKLILDAEPVLAAVADAARRQALAEIEALAPAETPPAPAGCGRHAPAAARVVRLAADPCGGPGPGGPPAPSPRTPRRPAARGVGAHRVDACRVRAGSCRRVAHRRRRGGRVDDRPDLGAVASRPRPGCRARRAPGAGPAAGPAVAAGRGRAGEVAGAGEAPDRGARRAGRVGDRTRRRGPAGVDGPGRRARGRGAEGAAGPRRRARRGLNHAPALGPKPSGSRPVSCSGTGFRPPGPGC